MVVYDMSFEEYKAIDAVNNSTLKLVAVSPALVLWDKECPKDDEDDDAGVFGNALHCIVLEPNEFDKRYAVAPTSPRNTKEGKAEHAEFELTVGDRIVIGAKDKRKLVLMWGSVMAHPEARAIIDACKKEVTYICDHGTHKTKSRHDLNSKKLRISGDLKSIDPGNKPFAKAWADAVEERCYDEQEAHYRHDFKHETGEDLKDFFFIAVSKRKTLGRYETHVMRLTKEQRENGEKLRKRNTKRYLECLKSGKFPGIETTETPKFSNRGEI